MKTQTIVLLLSLFASVACVDLTSEDGAGGRSQRASSATDGAGPQGSGGGGDHSSVAASGTSTSGDHSSVAASGTSTSGTSTSTSAASTSASTTSSGGPVECDLNQTADDVVLGCAEGVCAAQWGQLTACQAGCGVFPSASCMLQNCVDEVLAFSQCLSTCPEYVACDPCLLSCIHLKNCGLTTLAACYATCPAKADDAVWACGASMLCEVVPMCPQLQGL